MADEVFRPCLARVRAAGDLGPITIYDPCCGAGYHLAVPGFLHSSVIRRAIASDIGAPLVQVALRNLALLDPQHLTQRSNEVEQLKYLYGKASHRDAHQSAIPLYTTLKEAPQGRRLETRAFVCDALGPEAIRRDLADERPNIMIVDIPYRQRSSWLGASEGYGGQPLQRMREAPTGALQPGCVGAVVSDKAQSAAHPACARLERFQIGKRRVVILQG